jgi:FdhD protein
MGRNVRRVPVVRWQAGSEARTRDTLVVEEPLELRIAGHQLAVTMRTPGDDFDLAAGYLVGEGVIRSAEHLSRMRFCGDDSAENTYNVIDIDLAAGVDPPHRSLHRNTYTTSACGVCGKSSIEAVHANAHWSVADDPLRVGPEILCRLPDALREGQRLFEQTGGLHAAGLFTAQGQRLCIREDVGRHNAVDKVVGWALREGRLPLRGTLLMVSGRASFELVQKAAAAGIPLLAAVSAPSSLAVELARSAGLTLAGFVRGQKATVYTGAQRVASDHSSDHSAASELIPG